MSDNTTDETLANIDAVLGAQHEVAEDWEVSGDAMRSIPVDEAELPEWAPPGIAGAEPSFENYDETHHWTSADLAALSASLPSRPFRHMAISHPRQFGRSETLNRIARDLASRSGDVPVVLGFDGSADGEEAVFPRYFMDTWSATPPPRLTPDERMNVWLQQQAYLDEIPAEHLEAYYEQTAGTLRGAAMRVRFEYDELIERSKATRLVAYLSDRYVFWRNWWVSSSPRRTLRRLVGKPTPRGRSIAITITADTSGFQSAMQDATAALRVAFARTSVSAAEAATSMSRLLDRMPATTQRALRTYQDRREIRGQADVHRHELKRWLDEHMDAMYADLGIERETS